MSSLDQPLAEIGVNSFGYDRAPRKHSRNWRKWQDAREAAGLPTLYEDVVDDDRDGGIKEAEWNRWNDKKNNPPAGVKRRIKFDYEEQMRGLDDDEWNYGGQSKMQGRLRDGFAIMRGEYVEDLHETDMYAVEEGW